MTNIDATVILERILGYSLVGTKPQSELTSLKDWDSLKMLQLVIELDSSGNGELSAEVIESLRTIEDVNSVLQRGQRS